MVEDKGRKRLPPYISYRTFHNFIDRLQQGIPARIDRSYWSDRLSGSTGTQLMSALRFLGLIDGGGMPTSRLRLLASARDAQRTEILNQIANERFSFLLKGIFDFQSSTYAQLEEAFHNEFELTDGVSRKCVKFFVELANAAGIPLSPFIAKRLRSVRSSPGTKPVLRRREAKTNRNVIVPQDLEVPVPTEMSWNKMMLAKFPTFDPTWADEVKLGWFEAFDALKFPTFDPIWSDEVKLKWFEAFDKLLGRDLPKSKKL